MPTLRIPRGGHQRPGASVVTVRILVAGREVGDELQLLEVAVDHALDSLPRAVLTLSDGGARTDDFPVSSSRTFQPGVAIEVRLGRDADDTTVFTGVVLAQRIRVDADLGSTLQVECGDRAARMAIAPASRQFFDMADSHVMEEVIHEAGLEPQVEPTSTTHDVVQQQHVSDWDFVVALARANGMVVTVDDGRVTVGLPAFGGAAVKFVVGDDILDLDLELDVRTQFAGVTVAAGDPGDQAVVTATASEPAVNRQGRLSGVTLASVLDVAPVVGAPAATPLEALQAQADALLLASRLAKVRGTVTTSGTTKVRPGDLVDLAGLGSVFEGAGFASGVRHELQDGEWQTQVTFGMAPPSTATLAPAVATNVDSHDGFGSIVTQSGLRLDFDDERPSVQVSTPGGRVMTLDDDAGRVVVADAGGSSITMEGGGIALVSPADVTIAAQGSVDIRGEGGVTLHSDDDLAATARDVTLQGDVAVAITGGATTTVSSDGQTTVEGSIVRIN